MDTNAHRTLARQDAAALAEMVSLGVTISTETSPEQDSGCSSCTWHAENAVADCGDGGSASSILHWVKEGYLGKPEDITLHPVVTP